jgi:hypothetical protein
VERLKRVEEVCGLLVCTYSCMLAVVYDRADAVARLRQDLHTYMHAYMHAYMH